MIKKYTINRRKRTWGNTWILSCYDTPDNQGRFQHVYMMAEFGNTKNKRNYQNAKLVKSLLESD